MQIIRVFYPFFEMLERLFGRGGDGDFVLFKNRTTSAPKDDADRGQIKRSGLQDFSGLHGTPFLDLSGMNFRFDP